MRRSGRLFVIRELFSVARARYSHRLPMTAVFELFGSWPEPISPNGDIDFRCLMSRLTEEDRDALNRPNC